MFESSLQIRGKPRNPKGAVVCVCSCPELVQRGTGQALINVIRLIHSEGSVRRNSGQRKNKTTPKF